jgi:hypothetical protein
MVPFATPLVRSEEVGAAHIGSGGYVETGGRKLLLTSDHVVRKALSRLAHTFYDSDQYLNFQKAFASEMWPTDLAASPVDVTWRQVAHSAMAFPERRFAEKHAPEQKELLFMLGFAGSRAYYSPTLNIMLTNGTPYLSQEFDPLLEEREITVDGFDPSYHFAIPWQPEQIVIEDENNKTVPLNPDGFSGSLVWNTRYLEYSSTNRSWEPGVARLTGIVWGWSTEERVLVATRVEHVKHFLERIS